MFFKATFTLHHVLGLEHVSTISVLPEPTLVNLELFIRGLKVESGHLETTQPKGDWVKVG